MLDGRASVLSKAEREWVGKKGEGDDKTGDGFALPNSLLHYLYFSSVLFPVLTIAYKLHSLLLSVVISTANCPFFSINTT